MQLSSDFPERLRSALRQKLPGQAAQLTMAHQLRVQELVKYQIASDHSLAGVVVLIFAEGDTLKTTLIARSANPRDVHSGQISFPGGRIEPTDASIEAGAYRELMEEVGVPLDTVQPLGALTPLYIPVSKFMVHPFVAFASTPPSFTAQISEVRSILTPELGYLLNPDSVKYKDMTVGTYQLREVPYLDIDSRALWGATAMILGELREVVAQWECF